LNNFDVNNGRIFIKAQSVTSLIKNGFTLSNGADIIVKHLDGSILNEVEYAGTGMKVCITIGGIVKKEFTAVITGDVSGDGFINAIDLLLIKRSILGMTALTDAYAEAANIDRDANGSITAIDLLKLKRFVLGIDTIA
jgi:hypothetical protein